MTISSDELVRRNAAFAATGAFAGLPSALRSWALLGRLGQGQPPRSGHLVILHHTDCGIRRLAAFPEQLAAFFEIPADELETKAVADPHAAVRVDAAIARRALPPGPPGRDPTGGGAVESASWQMTGG